MNESSASTFGSLGRKAVAWVILLAVAVLALKIVIGIVTGLFMALIWAVVGIAIVLGVLWAFKHL
jgi:flagellar biosynthesis protein FliQ